MKTLKNEKKRRKMKRKKRCIAGMDVTNNNRGRKKWNMRMIEAGITRMAKDKK